MAIASKSPPLTDHVLARIGRLYLEGFSNERALARSIANEWATERVALLAEIERLRNIDG